MVLQDEWRQEGTSLAATSGIESAGCSRRVPQGGGIFQPSGGSRGKDGQLRDDGLRLGRLDG